MSVFERVFYFFNDLEMTKPTIFGWFHWLWIFLTIFMIIFLFFERKNYSEKQLKKVLMIYGIIALLLEVLKQIMWSFNYDSINNLVIWNYEWYAFPFQLCTTPIFVSIICSFCKKNIIRDSLLSYMAFVTILGSIATIVFPESCFVEDILINIHTMWLHCGSLVVSVYLLMNEEVKINLRNLKQAIIVFMIFIVVAQLLNIGIYQSGILNGESFNMFYISPYFISTLPIFDVIQKSVPYFLFLITYICIITAGSFIIYLIAYFIKEYTKKV